MEHLIRYVRVAVDFVRLRYEDLTGRFHEFIKSYAFQGQTDLPISERSHRYAFTFGSLLGGFSAFLFFLFYYFYDAFFFSGNDLDVMEWSALGACIFGFYPFLLRFGLVATALTAGTLAVAMFFWMAFVMGAGSGLYLFQIVVLAILFLLLGARKRWLAVLFSCLTAVAMLFSRFAFREPSALVKVDETFLDWLNAIVLVSIGFQLLFTMTALSVQVARAEAALAAEHARSEALLQNLLPDEIAARLKDRPGEIIADGLPAVTLLFADIVDFTPRSAARSPNAVVDFLNRIFSRFDALTEERGLEKIKTIGDAYMVAAGLPAARDDHAFVIADMALALQAAVADLGDEMGETVNLRIGIHSGPAIAGVIGTSKVFYDVWGDTVNTASRMESQGEPGRIQLTAETRHLLGDDYVFQSRGLIDIKGKGQIETFWLLGRAPA